jgi:hypothetical protein
MMKVTRDGKRDVGLETSVSQVSEEPYVDPVSRIVQN